MNCIDQKGLSKMGAKKISKIFKRPFCNYKTLSKTLCLLRSNKSVLVIENKFYLIIQIKNNRDLIR